jgi:HlyD family secretion protein
MKYLVIIVLLLAVLGGGGMLLMSKLKRADTNTAAAAQTGFVTRKTIEKVVTANGKVASNRDVDIKCQASGTIKVLAYSDVSKEVKPGEMLVQLDPVDMQRLADTAKAVLDADEARLKEAELNLEIAKLSLETTRQRSEASLASARSQAADAHAKAERTRQLYEAKPTALASKEELDTAQTTAALADASVQGALAAMEELKQMKIQVDTRAQQVEQIKASKAQDKSRYDTALQNVSYCTVYAPAADNTTDPPRWFISSLLTNIAPGYIVQSGTSGFSAGTTLMTLSDLSHVFILASVDESDIGQVIDPARGGEKQRVKITADSFPGQQFEGEVVRVATKGVNTSNVVTFEVKIEVTSDNKSMLRPEMTATARIVTASRPNVLAIPTNAFLRGEQAVAVASVNPPAGAAPATEGAGSASAASRRGPGGGGGRGAGGRGRSPTGDDVRVDGTVNVMENGKQVSQAVTVGLTDGESYEVITGLEEGDEVVLNKMGSDSRWRGQSANQQMMRGMGGGRGR